MIHWSLDLVTRTGRDLRSGWVREIPMMRGWARGWHWMTGWWRMMGRGRRWATNSHWETDWHSDSETGTGLGRLMSQPV